LEGEETGRRLDQFFLLLLLGLLVCLPLVVHGQDHRSEQGDQQDFGQHLFFFSFLVCWLLSLDSGKSLKKEAAVASAFIRQWPGHDIAHTTTKSNQIPTIEKEVGGVDAEFFFFFHFEMVIEG
jgi:hypothetical protein